MIYKSLIKIRETFKNSLFFIMEESTISILRLNIREKREKNKEQNPVSLILFFYEKRLC